MNILFFDTETTGLPKNWNAPVEQLDNWPRLVQIAWQVYNSNGELLEEHEYIIKPIGFIIPSEASAVHKITTEKALETGVDLLTILKVFSSSVKSCGLMVAHNYSYDYNIMGSELLRNDLENSLKDKEQICTMKASTEFCKIPGPYGYKWPKLEELYKILFNESFNAHNALDDIRATARCFWDLSKKEVISIKKTLASASTINQESQRIIHRCWDISKKIQATDESDKIYKKISEVLMNFGDKRGALNEIKKIKSGKIKSEAIFYFSKTLIDQGKIDESINFSKEISNREIRNKIQLTIVKELLSLRNVTAAIQIASEMAYKGDFFFRKSDAFFEISKYHIKNGDWDLAIISHKQFKIPWFLDRFIKEICSYLANIGKVGIGHVFINYYLSKVVFDEERKQELFKKLPVEYQKNRDNDDTENSLLKSCLEYCKSGLIDNAIELLKKEEITTSSRNIILEIAEELLFNQNDFKNSLFVSSKYNNPSSPFLGYSSLIHKALKKELPFLAYKILPSISDEDEKIGQEVGILIHLGDLDKAEAVASKHSYLKPISESNYNHKHKRKKYDYVYIIKKIIYKYLDLNKIDKANLLFKKIDENEDLRKGDGGRFERSLDSIKGDIIDKTAVSFMMNGQHNEAEKIINGGNYYKSHYNLAAMFMALGNLEKALEHAEASVYYNQDSYYNIILVLLERKKIDTAVEVYKLMSFLEVYEDSDLQKFDYKYFAREEIIESLLLEDVGTNYQINKRITSALALCKDDSGLGYSSSRYSKIIETLCKANLHSKALKIIENLPWLENREKDEYFLMVAESLMDSINPGKGLIHKVYDHNKEHYGRGLNPVYCRDKQFTMFN